MHTTSEHSEGWQGVYDERGTQTGSIDPEGNRYVSPVAGDVIILGGRKEYVFKYVDSCGESCLTTNAVNRDWVNSGRRGYREETYELSDGFYQVVGHYGNGGLIDGQVWYEDEFQDDINPQMSY